MDKLLIKDLDSFTSESFLQEFSKDGCYNFRDWFCKDTSLKAKAKSLFSKVKRVVKANTKFNFSGEGTYVFFKNNCPCYGNGHLYDSFSICDSNGNVIAWFTSKNPYDKAELFCKGHGFEMDTESYQFNTFKDLLNFLKVA